MPTLHHDEGRATVWHGDCLDVLRELPDASVDAIVTDPPYGLSDLRPAQVTAAITAWAGGDRERVPDARGFMGRSWDAFVPPPAVWDECLRVLKPGGHLAAFTGSRTYDLMGIAIRMAGFEIRDGLMWQYASGMPKGLDVSKAIDKAAGATREVVGSKLGQPGYSVASNRDAEWGGLRGNPEAECSITAPATDDARRWDGWNTALKPAHEPIVLARKPLEGTVAGNVLAHGVGAMNIDACRVQMSATDRDRIDNMGGFGRAGWTRADGTLGEVYKGTADGSLAAIDAKAHAAGRWPANTLLSHAPGCGPDGSTPCVEGCPVVELDQQSGTTPSNARANKGRGMGYHSADGERGAWTGGDSGGASRFFPTFRYQAKAPKSERPKVDGVAHPTCKPLAVMAWLARLLCPPGGTVLEPFAGSGTTIEACLDEGFRVIGVEREAEYLPLIDVRVARAVQRAQARESAADSAPVSLFDVDTAA